MKRKDKYQAQWIGSRNFAGNDLTWEHTIRPMLEPTIKNAKSLRLADEREEVIKLRTAFLDGLYKAYLKQLVPSQWLFHPQITDVAQFPIFHRIIHAEGEVGTMEDTFTAVISEFPDLVSAWVEERRERLRATLSDISTATGERAEKGQVDVLDLATSVFKCGQNNICRENRFPWSPQMPPGPLFGFGGAISHRCIKLVIHGCMGRNYPITPIIVASPEGSSTATVLVQLSGMDPTRATVIDMDEMDPLFVCCDCPPYVSNLDGNKRRVIHTWRSAVKHAMSKVHGVGNAWRILTPHEMDAVERPVDPIVNQPCWTCNHCSAYFDAHRSRQEVELHLSATYDPKE
ncbi:hypothetical protein H0H81_010739 [Sphagnurus paluster]|uniref:Uncharacterized protein n=1 Tax=Sphagnurus paluster TaxID=117069 RepID=A0A9P7GHV0_9AGAR|nr:hypothetical protein H0H81_010739 [Sphagnurus paluster]